MYIQFFENVLKREFSQRTIDKYSIRDFCLAAKISRGTFYRNFKNFDDLFCQILQFEIDYYFTRLQSSNLRKTIHRLLLQIEAAAIYYRNIHHFASSRIRTQLNHALFVAIQKLLFNSELSNKHIQSISGLIFIRILDWVSHDYQDNLINVYTDIECIVQHHLWSKRLLKLN